MKTCPRIAVHPNPRVQDPERAAAALGCVLILEEGRVYLAPRGFEGKSEEPGAGQIAQTHQPQQRRPSDVC